MWGNTYPTNLNLLFMLKKRAVIIITFSKFDEHSTVLFKQTNIQVLKLSDLSKFQIGICICMYKFQNNQLTAGFNSYFLSISKVHNQAHSQDFFVGRGGGGERGTLQ